MDNLSSLSVAACAALDTCQAPTKNQIAMRSILREMVKIAGMLKYN